MAIDKEIISLHKAKKIQELRECVGQIQDRELTSLIDQRIMRGRADPCDIIRAVLAGLPGDKKDSAKTRLEVYKHCIEILQGKEINPKTGSEMVGVLMMEADEFTAACLADLAAMFVDNIKNGIGSGKSLELFPKILSSIEVKDSVAYGGHEMSGPEYKSHILNSLCSGRWDSGTVIHLAAMFKDVPLTQDELKFVLNKILRMLRDVDIQELPPLVYQLLLLSTKVGGPVVNPEDVVVQYR